MTKIFSKKNILWKTLIVFSALIIGFYIYLTVIFWLQTRLRPLKNLEQIESHIDLVLNKATNSSGYFTQGFASEISWVKCEIMPLNFEGFLLANNLSGKLVSSDENHTLTKAIDYNKKSIENFRTIFFEKVDAEVWMPSDFKPLFAFDGQHPQKAETDHLSMVVGYRGQSTNVFQIYIYSN